MNFFLVHIKSLVYEMPVPSVESNVQKSVAAKTIRDMPGIFPNARNSMQRLSQVPDDFRPYFLAPVVVQPFNKMLSVQLMCFYF
ncbi:hypothetical protein TNCV_3548631 [Trichonephila clavipes]|nr:hypothetical protein TNCV_3548631 [Trichonephila clavipes]